MTPEPVAEILKRLRAGLAEILGDQLETVYLYGSQARGDARSDSDIDILIVLRGDFDYFRTQERLSGLAWELSLENDVVISQVLVSKENFDQPSSPFLINAHREAVLV